MTLRVKDRVKEGSITDGVGNLFLRGASLGYQTFASVLSDGDITYYCAADLSGPNWEVGIGSYNSDENSIVRTTVLSSSSNNSIVNFNTDAKEVFITYPAERVLEIVYGGTGATNSADARINLGVEIGADVQRWDPDLDSIASLIGNAGVLRKTAANTWVLNATTTVSGGISDVGKIPVLDNTGRLDSTLMPSEFIEDLSIQYAIALG